MSRPIIPLTRGDRAPNFALPDQTGTTKIFYTALSGGPIVLFAARNLNAAGARAALAGLAGISEQLRTLGANLFAVGGGPTAEHTALALSLGLDFPLFSDANGNVLQQLLASADRAPTEFRVLVLDPNQRVLAGIESGEPDTAASAALEAVEGWCRADPTPLTLTSAAPVLMLPDVFDKALCDQLIDVWRTKGHEEGGDAGGYGSDVKQSGKKTLDHVIEDSPLNDRICETLLRRIGPELRKVFRYFADGVYFDRHIIISYQADRGDFFGPHRDNFTRETQNRVFAVSINLNDDFDGGELWFPEYGRHRYRPGTGTACVFSCSLLHEAMPVTRGQRWVLTSFFWM